VFTDVVLSLFHENFQEDTEDKAWNEKEHSRRKKETSVLNSFADRGG
jgi:hypothetical protein